ncbi:MAG: hypothetical protein ACE15B_17715 [Bryobacteraceae bacterium]
MTSAPAIPRLFEPNPYLSDAVNRNIMRSEIEGGVHLCDVQPGAVLEIETQNRAYTLQYEGLDRAFISGHPVFCPQPILVTIHGSTWGGSILKTGYIGRGMRLEFGPSRFRRITTSVIRDIRAA